MELEEYTKLTRMLADAFVDTVRDAQREGSLCPEGPMYLAYMEAGGDLQSFQNMIEALVRTGRLIRSGHNCLRLGPKEKL